MQKKEEEAKQRRLKRQLAQAEEAISQTEEHIENIEKELCKEEVMTDPVRLAELGEALGAAKEKLAEEYDKWMELQEIS